MEKNRDVGKILLKINSQYYEKGMKNISIQLKGVRKGKIAEMDRKVIIPQIIRSKEYNIFEKQFLKNIDDEIKNIAKQDKVQEIVNNPKANFYTYEDYALVGTKGYCYEGKDSYEHFLKIRERELGRLRCSFEGAKAAGYEKFIMFLHYPPTSIGEMESPFTLMAQEFGAEKVIYSHCHGEKRYDDSFKGYVDGIEYKLVSGDYLNFKPELVLR